MHQLLQLTGSSTTATIEFEVGQMPLWRHYGQKLAATPLLQSWAATRLKRQPPGTMDRLDGVPLLAGFGNGFHFGNALLVHQDGHHGFQEFVATGFERHDDASHHRLVISLRDGTSTPQAQLEVSVTLSMHLASDVLTLETRLTHRGTGTLQVDALASGTLGACANLQELAYFSGQWAHEFQWNRAPLGSAGWRVQNRRGKTSHETPSACFLLASNTDDHSGEVIAAHVGWSGNHQLGVDRQDDGSFALQGGQWLAPGEVRLDAGESFETPPLHVTWSDKGINGASQNLHRYARQSVLRWHGGRMCPRPVHLNTWEAVYFDHDQAVLRDLAERAAALGLERFVLDDGWFPGRPNDMSGLGDWWPDPVKYPEGLGPLIDHVISLGLEFGLWVEPEMVNPDSDLYRAHPDWALQSPSRDPQFGRQQLVLDIARPEVSDYLFRKLDALLSAHPIAYLKWDMNRDLAQAEDSQGRLVYGKQVRALYALLDRVHTAHPAVEIESCASGGGRMDLGVLRHTQRFWTSDNNDALSRVAIQSGAARLFPLEVLGSHVGPAPAHSTGRTQSMDFRGAIAMFGHMGVEADVRHLSAEDQAALQRWVGHYKTWRDVIHRGTYSQGKTAHGVWWLVQTDAQCILNVITTSAPDTPHHAPVRLAPFCDQGLWRVRILGKAGLERARGSAPSLWLDALAGDGVVMSGAELVRIGLPVPNMNPESALVLAFDRISD
jgi:alpha-galactosidase